MNGRGAGFASGTFAGSAEYMLADFHGFFRSEGGVFKRDGDIGAQVCAGSLSTPAAAEEITEDVSEG